MIKAMGLGQARALTLAVLGAFVLALGIVTYPIISTLSLTQGIVSESVLLWYAYSALAFTASGLVILFLGATMVLTRSSIDEEPTAQTSYSSIVAQIFTDDRYSRLLVLSTIVYGLFYAFASGIIVYQPSLNFAEVYHAMIPSLTIAACCGPVGQTPEAVLYVSRHLGIVVVPFNLLLLFSVSWLVGLNVAFAAFALSIRSGNLRTGWLGGLGAIMGLFTSCPTCAGLAIIALLGGTGPLSASFFLGPLQILFVGFSVPVLITSPILTARSLRNRKGQACQRS